MSLTSPHGIIEIALGSQNADIPLAIDGVGRRLDLQTKH